MPNIKGNISGAWHCLHKGYMYSRYWAECVSDITRSHTVTVQCMCSGFSWLNMREVVYCDRRHGEYQVILVRAIKTYGDVEEYLRLLYFSN
jgi:hypothetical protein